MVHRTTDSIWILTIVLALGLMANSCYYDKQNALQPNPADVCDSTFSATYAASVQSIVQGNCLSCHSSTNPKGGVDLSSYEKLKAATESGALLPSIRREGGYSAMPPDGPMRSCETRKLEKWMLDSFPR
jgi:mono/diheme cytochrome c family protein